MSRVCCEKINGMCEYHNEYNNGGGDSYKVEGRRKDTKGENRDYCRESKVYPNDSL